MNENFISSTIKIVSSNAEGILNLFKERLSVQNDNFKDQKNFGKLINDNIASKVRMNIKSDDWLKGNNNPDWCIVSEIHLDLNQIDLMSADNKYSFNNMAPCLTALLYIYHECNLKDENMQIETRSQDNNLSFAEAEFVTGKIFYGTSMPIIKKKTWWDSPNNKVGLGSLFQGSQKIMKQGSPIMTGGALDLNISGRGFFILSPKVGADPRFTRDGSFSLDASGNLITTDGFNVAGFRRDEVNGLITTLAEPINIPLSIENIEGRTVSLTGINIDAYGNIETTYGLNNIVQRGKIALAKFNNDTELKSVGSNAFQATSKSGLQVLGSPLEGNFGEIMSGALESSNTDITNEMVSMMRTQQAFNGNARIMQTSVDITRRLME